LNLTQLKPGKRRGVTAQWHLTNNLHRFGNAKAEKVRENLHNDPNKAGSKISMNWVHIPSKVCLSPLENEDTARP
jgi:hypothetical protein